MGNGAMLASFLGLSWGRTASYTMVGGRCCSHRPSIYVICEHRRLLCELIKSFIGFTLVLFGDGQMGSSSPSPWNFVHIVVAYVPRVIHTHVTYRYLSSLKHLGCSRCALGGGGGGYISCMPRVDLGIATSTPDFVCCC